MMLTVDFNWRLYREGLRQLRIIGWATSFITIIAALLVAMSGWACEIINDFAPLLITYMFIVPPLLALVLFRVFNHRNSADFFHALAPRRTTLFAAWTAAALTYITATMLAATAVMLITRNIRGLWFSYDNLPSAILICLVGAGLTFAVTVLAMTLTGNLLSNLITTVVIFFVPSLCGVIFVDTVYSWACIVPKSYDNVFTEVAYNFPLGLILANFSSLPFAERITLIGGIIYTGGLALFYLLLAGYAFKHRPSETAEQNFVHPWLQSLLLLLIALVPAWLFAIKILQNKFGADFELFLIVITLFLLGYYGVTLLLTRKFKPMLRSSWLLLPLSLLIAGLMGGMYLIKEQILSVQPTAAEISGVNFGFARNDNEHRLRRDTNNNFNRLLSEQVIFTDLAMRELVAENLRLGIAAIRQQDLYGERYSDVVTITLADKRQIERYLSFIKKDYSASQNKPAEQVLFESLLFANPEYVAAQTALPSDEQIASIYVDNRNSDKFAQKMWQSFKQEFAALSPVEKLRWLQNCDAQISITVDGKVAGREFYQRYAIAPCFPQTFGIFIIDERNRGSTYRGEEWFKKLSKLSALKSAMVEIKYWEDGKEKSLIFNREPSKINEVAAAITKVLNAAIPRRFTTGNFIIVKIIIGYLGSSGGYYSDNVNYFYLTAEELASLKNLSSGEAVND